jgi:hypothetical protein
VASAPTAAAPAAARRMAGAPAANSSAAIPATSDSEISSVVPETSHRSGTTAIAPMAAPARSNAYTRPIERA